MSKPQQESFHGLLLLVNIALGVALTLLAGIFLGMHLDKHFHTEPLFLLAGILLGLTAAFCHVYRLLVKHNRP